MHVYPIHNEVHLRHGKKIVGDSIEAFRNNVKEYRTIVEHDGAVMVHMRAITNALADTSAIEDSGLWWSVIDVLSDTGMPPEDREFWITWINLLDTKTRGLPGLLLRIRMSNIPIYDDPAWIRLRKKVAFFDEQIDHAYLREPALSHLRTDRLHLGKHLNRLMEKGLPSEKTLTKEGIVFKFKENTNHAWNLETDSTEESRIEKIENLKVTIQ